VLLEAVHRLPHDSLLVVKETQFQESVRLSGLVPLLIGYVQQVFQMLDSLVHIPILRVGLCQLFMSFASLGLIVRFFTQVQEFVQKFYRLVKVSKHLVDVSNFLIALCLLVSILSALGCVQALLEKLKRLVEIVLVLELDGDNLVHSDKLSRDFLFDFAQVSINSFLKSSFQIAHGVENVEDFLFANSETHVCFGLSLDELGLDTYV
jgi:hypothetical protein